MPGTDARYALRLGPVQRVRRTGSSPTRRVPTTLRARYAALCTGGLYWQSAHAVSGTDLANGATRAFPPLADLLSPGTELRYLPTRMLYNAGY
eukprot:1394291-Rhodomonas_salina.3